MKRADLNRYLVDVQNILEQLPKNFEVICVSIDEARRPAAQIHVYNAWDALPAEAAEWGETLVEEEYDDDGWMVRYFDGGNVRVFCLKPPEVEYGGQ